MQDEVVLLEALRVLTVDELQDMLFAQHIILNTEVLA